MSDAINKLHDYLAKSPSVVYPENVLAYLPAIEGENTKLKKLAVGLMHEAAEAMESAANTIWDLHKKLVAANADVRKAHEENAKLRDVVAQMYRDMQGVLDMSTDTVFVDSIGTLRDAMDIHMQAMAKLGMPPADYERRMRELGMDVES